MDAAIKKKLMAVGAAALGAIIFGESQIIDMEERLKALEDIHPELEQQDLDEIAEELQSDEQEASDEDQIEAEEAEAEAQPLIEADKE